MRRLQVTGTGKWYLVLTILIGVVALMSGNNVIYLIESLLLSGLILSGILSERAISGVHIELIRAHAVAGEKSRDRIRITNKKSFPIFCLEIGEWSEKKFIPLTFIPRLEPQSVSIFESHQEFEKRGIHRWSALAIGTSYPFGFARKIKLITVSGERFVWPERKNKKPASFVSPHQTQGIRMGGEFAEGEIRQISPDDDLKSVVWTLSAKSTELSDWYVRPRKANQTRAEITFDRRLSDSHLFENQIISVADPFYESDSDELTLIIIDSREKRRLRGKVLILNTLSTITPEAKAS